MPTLIKSNPLMEMEPQIQCTCKGRWLQIHNSKGFEFNHASLPIPGLPDELEGFRILHLTDLHAIANWDAGYDQLISQISAHPPDMLLCTGDFVDDRHDPRGALANVQKLLHALPSRLGIYATTGNHDGDFMPILLRETPITFVHQHRVCLDSAKSQIELIGLPGVDRKDFDQAAFRHIEPKRQGAVRIVLSHYPEVALRAGFLKPDIILTGHTHGGQICLPGRIAIFRHSSIPRRYVNGIHRVDGAWLVASRGFGFSSLLRVRLFCPAEVLELTLTRQT